jgi:hypothetical protein
MTKCPSHDLAARQDPDVSGSLARDQTARTLVASGPLVPCLMSYSTFCPASRR